MQVFGFLQDGLQRLNALIAQVVEGTAAVTNGVTHQTHSLLDDGVGVAELEDGLNLGNLRLSRLSLLHVTGHKGIVDGSHSSRPDIGTAGDAALAAVLQAEQDISSIAFE